MQFHEKHVPGECSIVPESDFLPSCVNCNENGHISYYRNTLLLRRNRIKEYENRNISAAGNVSKALNSSNAVVVFKSFASMFNKQT